MKKVKLRQLLKEELRVAENLLEKDESLTQAGLEDDATIWVRSL